MTDLFELQWQEFALRTLALHWVSSALVVALVVALVAVCRRLNATTRHNIWLLTLASLVLMPLLVFAPRPDVSLSVWSTLTEPGSASEVTENVASRDVAPAPSGAIDAALRAEELAKAAEANGETPNGPGLTARAAPANVAAPAKTLPLPLLIKGVFVVWLVGALYLLRRLWGEYRAARELELQSDSVTPYFERRFDQLCTRLGIEERPLLRFHTGISAPMTVGLLRVWVAIPMTWRETIDDSVFDQTLTHELGHIARKDPMTHTLQRVFEVVFWMYPAVWFVAHQLEVERESACDDWVLTHDGSRNSYAANLLDVAESLYLQPRVMAVGCLRSHSQLSRRIQNLLSKSSDHKVHTSWKLLLLVGLGLAGTLSVSAVVWPDARQLAPPAAPAVPAVAGIVTVENVPPPVTPVDPAKPRAIPESLGAPAPASTPESAPASLPVPASAPAPKPAPAKAMPHKPGKEFKGKNTTVWQNEQGKLVIERENNRVNVTVEPAIGPETPLLLAAWRGDMNQLWDLAGKQPKKLNTVFDRAQPPRTALEAAVLQGHKRLVEKMIHLGVDLNPGDSQRRKNGVENPLTLAAMTGNGELVKLLLKNGALPETRTLNVAVSNGDHAIVERLLKSSDCDCMNTDKALLLALDRKDDRIVDALVSADAEVTDAALLMAVQGNRTRLVDVLLAAYDDEPDEELLKLAIRHRNTGVLKSLLRADAEPDEGVMLTAVQSRNANLVKQLLKYDADMDEGALVLAIEKRDSRIAHMLIDGGAPISDGALTMAIQQGDTKLAHRLLSHDAAVGEGALVMAIQTQSEPMVRVLLDRGAEVDESALIMAAQTGNPAIMQLIRERSGRTAEDLQSTVLRSFDSGAQEAAYYASTNAADYGAREAAYHASKNAANAYRYAAHGNETGNLSDNDGTHVISDGESQVVTDFRLDQWPVDSTHISLGFHDTSPKHGSRARRHEALDFPMKAGSPVYAVAAGTVVEVGYTKGHGNYIVIDHGDDITAKYSNNQSNNVTKGQRVRAHQTIALVGNSGKDSTGPHLHFELKHGDHSLDPQALFKSKR